MPTLPLFDDRVPSADAAHRVRAPGGYETWHFVAYDAVAHIWISITFWQGWPCREYLRRYLRFRSHPTRNAPPQPAEYPAVSVSIYSQEWFTRSTVQFAASDFAAASGVRIGPHQFERDADGAIHLKTPTVDLVFRPLFSRHPTEQSTDPADTTHRWRLIDGLCNCTGVVDTGQSKIKFAGQGFHEQRYGTAPHLRHTLRGQIFFKDTGLALHQTDVMHVATFGRDSLAVEIDRSTDASPALTGWGISYPRRVRLTNGALIEHARVLHSDFIGAQVMYDASWFGEKGVAFCEISAAHRRAWPMI